LGTQCPTYAHSLGRSTVIANSRVPSIAFPNSPDRSDRINGTPITLAHSIRFVGHKNRQRACDGIRPSNRCKYPGIPLCEKGQSRAVAKSFRIIGRGITNLIGSTDVVPRGGLRRLQTCGTFQKSRLPVSIIAKSACVLRACIFFSLGQKNCSW